MGRTQSAKHQRGYTPLRDSDYYEGPRSDTDGSFTHSNFSFDDKRGRFSGLNRYGEQRVHHDSFQDDQFRNDYDPTYEDEYGMKHPYEHGGELNRWSDDIRSEASRESHFGKGPKGYQRSDARILEDACEILLDSPEIDATEIEVKVNDRVITLEGEVVSRRDKRLAEELIENVTGVLDVQNRLKVKHQVDGWIPGLGYAGRDQYGL